jgi:hypothetical protein
MFVFVCVFSRVRRQQRLDSFAELTESSIEYGESTSYRLHPAKTQLLNVPQLKQILALTRDLRQRQTFKAAGLRP